MTILKTGILAAAIGLAAVSGSAQTASKTITLPDGMMFPEGIVEDGTGSLIVSVFGSGAVLRIGADGTSEVFKSPGEDGLAAPVGVAVDLGRDQLWISSINPETFSSKLHLYALSTGELKGSVDAPSDKGPHFFNEIVVGADGRFSG